MSDPVYRIYGVLNTLVRRIRVGTNLSVLHLLWALVSGRFLGSRGAVVTALASVGLSDKATRRSMAALSDGRWASESLITAWNELIRAEELVRFHEFEGVRPVPVDMTGFFRPRLVDCSTKHYSQQAKRALPAINFGMIGRTGSVGSQRLLILSKLVTGRDDETEAALRLRTLKQAALLLRKDEALVVDAGFPIAELLEIDKNFVARMHINVTARRKDPPEYKGHGRPATNGEIVRPLGRTYKGKELAASEPDKTSRWKARGRRVEASEFKGLVLKSGEEKEKPFRIVVIRDPKYKRPLIIATTLSISAQALWRMYMDRWPVEQVPLAAKQMLGCEHSFVFSKTSRERLPELAMLAGNVLTYVAATGQPQRTGFWDRAARPTCGRLRRLLAGCIFAHLPTPPHKVREKQSPTDHLPKGIAGHRRTPGYKKPAAALNRAI
jgi:hypothetical protein